MKSLNSVIGLKIRLYLQIGFLLLIALGAMLEIPELWIVGVYGIPIYQVLAAIQSRVVNPINQISGRDLYDKTLAIIGMYFAPVFLVSLIHGSTDFGMILHIFLFAFSVLCILPWYLRYKAEKELLQQVPMFVFIGLTLSISITEAITSEGGFGGMLFLGMLVLLVLGPIMGIYYMVIEWSEYDSAMSYKKRKFLDLD